MKNPRLIAIIKNNLYKPALKQILRDINISENLTFKENLHDCLNGICKPKYLIIETEAIPEPITFSLEKIISKNSDCLILVLNTHQLEQSAEPYIHTLVSSNDSENQVHSKFKIFFSALLENTTTDSLDNTLSEREKEVVQQVARGKTNKEISDLLFISPHTVIAHRKNITAKLGIKTIAGLAVYAMLNGLIAPDEENS